MPGPVKSDGCARLSEAYDQAVLTADLPLFQEMQNLQLIRPRLFDPRHWNELGNSRSISWMSPGILPTRSDSLMSVNSDNGDL